MGRIARVLGFLRQLRNGANVTDITVDTGGQINATAEHTQPCGDDAPPLPTDYAALNGDAGTGRLTAIGYFDPINEPKALAGDKRIYARDAETGETVIELWLKADGTAVLENDNLTFTVTPDGSLKGQNSSGVFELQAAGNFVVNGVTIDTGGNITTAANVTASEVDATASLLAAGKELVLHTHTSASPGSPTSPNL